MVVPNRNREIWGINPQPMGKGREGKGGEGNKGKGARRRRACAQRYDGEKRRREERKEGRGKGRERAEGRGKRASERRERSERAGLAKRAHVGQEREAPGKERDGESDESAWSILVSLGADFTGCSVSTNSSLMISSKCALPFLGGRKSSTRSEKASRPTLSLF